MPYIDQNTPHAGSAEVLFTGMFDEPAGTVARTTFRTQLGTNNIVLLGGSGSPNVRILPMAAGTPINNIAVYSGGTAEVAGTHFWTAVCDLGMNVLAVTADQTGATYVTATTFLKNPVTFPTFAPYTGYYYCVVSASAGTTMPTMAGSAPLVAGMNSVPPVFAGNVPAQAAPPIVGQNLGAITPGAYTGAFWIS